MKKLMLKIATGAAAVGLLAVTMAPSAFAVGTISGNGALSHNTIKETTNCTVWLSQHNKTNVTTVVNQSGKTGKNNSSFNTTGSQSLVTGAVSNSAAVTVVSGDNTADVTNPCCGCGLLVGADVVGGDNAIVGNGALSTNKITVTNNNTTGVSQKSTVNVTTVVNQSGNTGGNNSSFNTGGDNSTVTGDVTNTTEVGVSGGSNAVTL